jgi:hypothetical protein
MEAFVVLFAGLAARGLGGGSDPAGGSGGAVLAGCAGLALGCLLVAGMLRSRAGYLLGWAVQVALVATGIWVPAMYLLGAVFGALWVTALRVGGRIERERERH